MPKDPVFSARSRVALARRNRLGDTAERTAREDLAAAHVERAIVRADPPLTTDHRSSLIARLVAQAPPFTEDQTDRIVGILRGGQK